MTPNIRPFQPLPTQRRTQIVATLGPITESPEQIEALITAGMNVARFNTKHNEPAWHHEVMSKVRTAAQKLGKEIPLLLDLQGPEIRITLINQKEFELKKGEEIVLTANEKHTDPRAVFLTQEIIDQLQVGTTLLLEDGANELTVSKKDTSESRAAAVHDCHLHTRKTINIPGVILEMPSLLPRDLEYIEYTQSNEVEYIGLSFVRSAQDIEILRNELQKRNIHSKIIAKIENAQAIEKLDEIIDAADAVMVARGDLGVELPYYEVPHWQKVIIEKCNTKGKFVITATQMLLSMLERAKPTRAEVSDVANAVYDGTSAVMLSEETTIGKFAVQAVEAQAKILAYHEQFV